MIWFCSIRLRNIKASSLKLTCTDLYQILDNRNQTGYVHSYIRIFLHRKVDTFFLRTNFLQRTYIYHLQCLQKRKLQLILPPDLGRPQ